MKGKLQPLHEICEHCKLCPLCGERPRDTGGTTYRPPRGCPLNRPAPEVQEARGWVR